MIKRNPWWQFCFLFLIFCWEFLPSKTASPERIVEHSRNFLDQHSGPKSISLGKRIRYEIAGVEPVFDHTHFQTVAYFVTLFPQGFMVYSANTNLAPLIAYSFKHISDRERFEQSELCKIVLEDMGKRLKRIGHLSEKQIENNEIKWRQFQTDSGSDAPLYQFPDPNVTPTGGWLETAWNQKYPFNRFCPIDRVTGQRSLTGCVATAMAQIVNYYKRMGSLLLDAKDRYQTTTLNIRIDQDGLQLDFPEFEVVNTRLKQIKVKYKHGIELDEQDHAILNFALGILLKTDYQSELSSCNPRVAAGVFLDRLNYSNADYSIYDRSLYHKMVENIINGRPALLFIPGHAIIVDGFKTDGSFHYNFGWGDSDPESISSVWYFPDQLPNEVSIDNGIINIQPVPDLYNPEIACSAESLRLPSAFPGTWSLAQRISISNPGDVPVRFDDIFVTGNFGISLDNVTFASTVKLKTLQSGESVTIYIKCLPTRIGTHYGRLGILASFKRVKRYLTVELDGTGSPRRGTDVFERYVSGRWSDNYSPYYIHNDISIAEGDTLVIDPGTEIVFMGSFNFKIGSNATLLAMGNKADSIRFMALDKLTGWQGISFSMSGSDDRLRYCILENGRSKFAGGVLSIKESSPVIEHSLIRNNTAGLHGGGAFLFKASPEITFCTFANNSGKHYGGSFYVIQSNPVISNSIISNSTAHSGGAIYCKQSRVVLTNNTIADNVATSSGGGIFLDGQNRVSVKNSILWANRAETGSTFSIGYERAAHDTIMVRYSDVDTLQSSWSYNRSADEGVVVWDSETLLCDDPFFYNSAIGDYRLQKGSPCIDEGDPGDEIGGEPFPHGYRINIGAFGGTEHAAKTTRRSFSVSFRKIKFRDDGAPEPNPFPLLIRNGSPESVEISEITLSDPVRFSFFRRSGGREFPFILDSGATDSVMVGFLSPLDFSKEIKAWMTIYSDQGQAMTLELHAESGKIETRTAESEQEVLPSGSRFDVWENYPNPFNSSTFIKYRIAFSGYVYLTIFDITGRQVCRLQQAFHNPGEYEFEWNGADDNGLPLASGLYFCRIEADPTGSMIFDNFTKVIRLMLIR